MYYKYAASSDKSAIGSAEVDQLFLRRDLRAAYKKSTTFSNARMIIQCHGRCARWKKRGNLKRCLVVGDITVFCVSFNRIYVRHTTLCT